MTDAASPDENLEALKRRLGQTEHDRRLSDRALIEQCYAKAREVERIAHELAVRLESAFPGGDLLAHCRRHERDDEMRERRRNRWRDFRSNSVFGVTLGLTLFVLMTGVFFMWRK